MEDNDTIHALELITDSDNKPVFGTFSLPLKFGDDMMLGPQIRLSQHIPCRSLTVVEMPVGFESGSRLADVDQIAVILSGTLKISDGYESVRQLAAGDMFKLPKSEKSEHRFAVQGTEPVLLVVAHI